MKRFLEMADELEERNKSFELYVQSINEVNKKYGASMAVAYVEHLRQQFLTLPIEEIRQRMTELPRDLKSHEEYLARQQRETLMQQKRKQGSLRIGNEEYNRAEGYYERAVCSTVNPEYEKHGMPMFNLNKHKGYYAVHVGGGWLPILKRDGYCDAGDAYMYTIDADAMQEDKIKMYVMDDFNVSYRDYSTPESQIIFSKIKLIPAKYITLDNIIPENEIEEAPPPYGIE